MLATERQVNFLGSLLAERPTWASTNGYIPADIHNLSIDEASLAIGLTLSIPKEVIGPRIADNSISQEEITEGSYWTHDSSVARVRKSRSSGRLYAEKLNGETSKFEYTKGLIFHLKARMSLEEAKAWGARHGLCCVCAKTLIDNKSVEMGIGPVCVKRV